MGSERRLTRKIKVKRKRNGEKAEKCECVEIDDEQKRSWTKRNVGVGGERDVGRRQVETRKAVGEVNKDEQAKKKPPDLGRGCLVCWFITYVYKIKVLPHISDIQVQRV